MAGGIIFAIVMVLVVPVGVMIGGAVWSAAIGTLFSEDGEPSADAAA